jgi:AcrR family transcriptional regulator
MPASQSTLKRSDKADASRARIMNAAAKLFRDKGYAEVNLRDIAAASGMQAGSLYYHFDSKEAIVTEILDAGIEAVHGEVEAAINALPSNSSGAELIQVAIVTHLRSLYEFSHYTSANVRIYSQVPSQVRKANLKARKTYEALWGEILSKAAALGAIRDGIDLKRYRLLLISSMNATLEWFDPRRGNLNEMASDYAAIMLNGLLPDKKSKS